MIAYTLTDDDIAIIERLEDSLLRECGSHQLRVRALLMYWNVVQCVEAGESLETVLMATEDTYHALKAAAGGGGSA